MNVNIIATTPSILRFIESSIGRDFSMIEKIIISGDLVSKKFRNYYKNKYNIDIYSLYGIEGCFVGMECRLHAGYHFDPTQVLVEIVNPTNYLPTTTEGLILLTSLNSQAIPIIRYKTDDLGKIYQGKCKCGSNWPRLQWLNKIDKRYEISDGVEFRSEQIEEALSRLRPKFHKCEIFLKDGAGGKDNIEFFIYFDAKFMGDERSRQILTKKVTAAVRNSSLNFKDVMFEEYANVKIVLKAANKNFLNPKSVIRIKELRNLRN